MKSKNKKTGRFTKDNLINKKFGRLKVIKYIGIKKKKATWLCKCDCGNIKKTITAYLNSGEVKSCGCLKNYDKKTHGMTKTKFYRTWAKIQERCNDKNNPYYAGRGIKCLWNNFEDFKKDMYSSFLKHIDKFGNNQTTIERINNNGNYELKNCKWATKSEQAKNRRNNNMCWNKK